MYNELKTTFLAKVENVMLARTIGIGFLVDLDLQVNFLNEIKTIISEAVTNAIVHGCLCDEKKSVNLNLSYDDVNVYIEVVDYGVGIEDIERAKLPFFTTRSKDERSGMGFTLMESFMDSLDVKNNPEGGLTVRMQKTIAWGDEGYGTI